MKKRRAATVRIETHESVGLSKSLRSISVFLILAFIGASPFLNRMMVIESSKTEQLLTNVPRFFDLFAFFKSQCALAMGVVFALLLLFLFLSKGIKAKDKRIVTATAVFLLLTAVSTLLSKVQTIAITGLFDRYEGVGVWFGYIISMFLAMVALRNRRDWKLLQLVLGFVLGVQIVVGLTQFFNVNVLDNPLIRTLIIPQSLIDQYQIGLLGGGGSVYGTVNNPNFYSQSLALLMMFPLVRLFSGKSGLMETILLVSGGAALAFTGCSGGISGFAAGVLAVSCIPGFVKAKPTALLLHLSAPLVTALALRISNYKPISNGDLFLCALIPIAFMAGRVVCGFIENGKAPFLKRILIISSGVILAGILFAVLSPSPDKQLVERITAAANSLFIDYPEGRMQLQTDTSNRITILGNSGNILVRNITNGSVKLEAVDELLEVTADQGFSIIYLQRLQARFTVINNRIYAQDARFQPIEVQSVPDAFGFVGKEKFGSGRGFIWSRSIPMLKHSLIWGIGPDVFPYSFPQYDYAGKINMGAPNILVDKPHNWYLQVAIGTGFVSLLCLLLIWKQVIQMALKALHNIKSSELHAVAGAAIGFITVYAVTGLFYDSIVSVSIWVWPVTGALIGLLSANPSGFTETHSAE